MHQTGGDRRIKVNLEIADKSRLVTHFFHGLRVQCSHSKNRAWLQTENRRITGLKHNHLTQLMPHRREPSRRSPVNRSISFRFLVAAPLILTGLAAIAQNAPSVNTTAANPAAAAQIAAEYGKLPLSFERNQGQAPKNVSYLARGANYGLYLAGNEAVLALHKPAAGAGRTRSMHKARYGQTPELIGSNAIGQSGTNGLIEDRGADSAAAVTDVVRMQLAGANAHAQAQGADPLPGTANYFLGSDPAKWHSNVPTFASVRYTGVYPGVDLVYYGNQRQLEYDFVVAPGASARPIRLHFAGAKGLEIDENGNLIIAAEDGKIAFDKPVVYQVVDGRRQPVDGRFQLQADNTAGFALGRYDHSRPLVIDPTLVYSSFLGGSNQDYIVAIAADTLGEVYATGLTWSLDFPLTPGAFAAVNYATATNDVSTAFVCKFNASGTALLYSTYLGGVAIPDTEFEQGDYGHSIAIDKSGDAYLTGWTFSADFPVTAGAYQKTNKAAAAKGATGFVTKINPTGTGLLYSTFLGGSTLEQPLSIAIDTAGDAYTSGYTQSTDYPTTASAFQKVNNSAANDGWNAFVTKMNPTGSGLVYSTYLGGSGEVGSTVNGLYTLFAVAVDKSGDAYTVGYAQSADYPITAKTAYQTTNNASGIGGVNITFTELNPAGSALLYSTFLGGSSTPGDFSEGLVLDSSDDAYITGYTYSSDFPVTKGAFQTTNAGAANFNSTGFAAKLKPSASGAASLVYSTFLGGSGGDQPTAPALDSSGDLYIPGVTASSDFPVTSNAYQSSNNGAANSTTNAFLVELNPTGTKEVYSTYFGGGGGANSADETIGDGAYTLALDGAGGVYIAGAAGSPDFPVTKGAFDTTYKSANNTAFLAKFGFGAASTLKATTTTLTASANPETVGGQVTFTAEVSALSGTGTPAGNVVFSIDEATVATVALNGSGKATYSTATLTAGQHYILASYAGNTTYASSGSGITESMTPATPVIAPAGGTYYSVESVTITDSTKGAVIYYTLDRTTPTASSTAYKVPFTVSTIETVKAIAISGGTTSSAVATAAYTVAGSPWALAEPATAIATPKATLNALVDTQGITGSYYFAYGTSSSALTSTTAKTALTASTALTPVSATLTTLKTKTKYYFQLVVTTNSGTGSDAVLSFTTD
jgi:hypothetical protein